MRPWKAPSCGSIRAISASVQPAIQLEAADADAVQQHDELGPTPFSSCRLSALAADDAGAGFAAGGGGTVGSSGMAAASAGAGFAAGSFGAGLAAAFVGLAAGFAAGSWRRPFSRRALGRLSVWLRVRAPEAGLRQRVQLPEPGPTRARTVVPWRPVRAPAAVLSGRRAAVWSSIGLKRAGSAAMISGFTGSSGLAGFAGSAAGGGNFRASTGRKATTAARRQRQVRQPR